MSYTPDNQKLSDPLEKAASALEELASPIRERLKNPNEWKDDHLVELASLLKEVTSLEVKLRLLAGQVR
jgi:hypothetical protein